jgi:hypothetical protein
MVTSTVSTLEQLSDFVNSILCQHNQLEVGAFPLTQRILIRAEQPCGIYFCLHGPRSVKFSAIWETQRNTILLYGANGERTDRIQLVNAPRLEMPAVAAA